MLYNLIERRKGKERVVMTDALPKVNDRMRTLRKGHRNGIKGQGVVYRIEATTETDKFYQNPHKINLSGSPKKMQRGRRKGS